MNKKDLFNLPNGTLFYLKYKRNNRIKTYEYIKMGDRIKIIGSVDDYGVDDFYMFEFDFTIDKNLIFVENAYYTIVKVVKIIKPTKFDEIYNEE